MPVTLAGLASSHAFTFRRPDEWDELRQRTRTRYAAKYGSAPPEVPSVESETTATNLIRFARIAEGLAQLKRELAVFRPDVLVILGDDQDEQFDTYIPQFAIYLGERIVAVDRVNGTQPAFGNHPELARHLYTHCVDAGIDVCGLPSLEGDRLLAHAHVHVLTYVQPAIPVVPIFLNAIHMPAPSPARCYRFGEILLQAFAAWPDDLRVAVYASGGLSHFSASFPYVHYRGPFQVGSISEQFDRDVVGWMRHGEGARFTGLPSSDLLDNGDVELRQWIALQGMLGERRPAWLIYEPFYRAVMGMSVGFWTPFEVSATKRFEVAS